MRMVENGGGGGGGGKCFPAGWHVGAKPCDSCKATAALLYCRNDSAFLCMPCDVKLHGQTRHERVWMCEVCEQAPAALTCKADAAALCITCDRDIHSANPLARRHERIPVVPFYDCAETVMKSSPAALIDPSSGTGSDELNSSITNDDNYNWGVPPHSTNCDVKSLRDTSPADVKSIEMLFADSDNLLDFDFPIPTDSRLQSHLHNSTNDSVVPVQMAPAAQIMDGHSPETRYEIDFTRSNINSYKKNTYPAKSLSHSVSSSSIEVGVVPERNSMSDISYPFVLQANSGVALNGSQPPMQLSGIDREARVLRYREKRKNRKFEKTIRYASRKAYAETRPRIKGRFAKRSESMEQEVDRWLTAASGDSSINNYGRDVDYGVVPSF